MHMVALQTANWTELHIACYYGHYDSVLNILLNASSLDECNSVSNMSKIFMHNA